MASQIEKLLGKSVDELEKMTDADLIAYLSPSFIFTRPEKQIVTVKSTTKTTSNQPRELKVKNPSRNALLAEALAMAEKIQAERNKTKS